MRSFEYYRSPDGRTLRKCMLQCDAITEDSYACRNCLSSEQTVGLNDTVETRYIEICSSCMDVFDEIMERRG
jgi:hypothetical protein